MPETNYVFLLSQEHPELPRAEAESVLRAEDTEYQVIDEKASLLFVDAETIPAAVGDRIAMTFEIGELLHTFKPDAYQQLEEQNIGTAQSFAVRKMKIDDTLTPDDMEQKIGRIIDANSEGTVDLEEPDTLYRVYLYNDTAYLCKIIVDVDRSQFEARQNQHRPFSSPVSIHPRLARALVNLSEVPSDGRLLDPFCGTGGILLEASLIGCDSYGLDLQEDMVSGSEENLAAFDASGDIRQGAFEEIKDVFADELPFDAIVTDLPYGKASKIEGDPTQAFVETAPDLVDGKVVFVTNDSAVNGLEPDFEMFVHRSMNRYVYILE